MLKCFHFAPFDLRKQIIALQGTLTFELPTQQMSLFGFPSAARGEQHVGIYTPLKLINPEPDSKYARFLSHSHRGGKKNLRHDNITKWLKYIFE